MKNYLAAYAVGVAMTAAAVGFGAATAHASDLQATSASFASSHASSASYAAPVPAPRAEPVWRAS